MKTLLKLFGISALAALIGFSMAGCGNPFAGSEIDIEMIYVPGGGFQMGNPNAPSNSSERPAHTVTLTGFYMGKYEVTQGQYKAVMGKLPENISYSGKGDNYPMSHIRWNDALVFCNKLSMMKGLTPAYRISGSTNPSTWGDPPTSAYDSSYLAWNAVEIVSGSTGYRLPTEAQWEYAAKGGNGSPGNYTYAGSNNADDVAWYASNSGYTTHPVGTKAPNGLGLYDMSGNESEFCWDWFGAYPSEAQTDPMGPSSGSYRVTRGGSVTSTSAEGVRCVSRSNQMPHLQYDIGFRLARPYGGDPDGPDDPDDPDDPGDPGVDPSEWTAVDVSNIFGGSIHDIIPAIAYGNGKFVAVGSSGQMAASTDGAIWTDVDVSNIFGYTSINAITYGNGKFIVGGVDGKMATSTNGTTWTLVDVTNVFGELGSVRAITYGDGKFVAGGEYLSSTAPMEIKIAYSSNGTTWTPASSSTFGTSSIYAITYDNGKFVAVGSSGKMATSANGTTWTAVSNSTFGTSYNTIYAVAYGNNTFVAGGANGKMATSANGTTWTAVSNSTFGTSDINGITYGNNTFVAVGQDGKIAYSENGTTWTAVADSTFGTSYIFSIAFGNNTFVTGGASGKMAYCGPQTPVVDDYNISGNLTQMEGNVTAVTVTAKEGKSPGAVTVLYNGLATVPQAAGSYAVTFNVAAAAGWNTASGLSAGTLEVTNQTPVVDDYNISGNLIQTAGNVSAITVTAKEGKSPGAVTVLYNGSATIPQTVGNYTVTFNVAAATGWSAASGLSVGTLTVGNQTPVVGDYNISGNFTQTAGSVTAVTVTAKEGKSPGTVTVLYNGSTTIPQTVGSYPVTFNVAIATGWNAANGLSAGMLEVNNKTTPTITSWPTAETITYGAALSTSELTGGTASVAGTFAWTDGATVPTVTNSGYDVTFTPTDTTNYNPSTHNVAITVNKADPSVTWPAGLTAQYGQTLSAVSLVSYSNNPAGTFSWTTPGTSVGALGTQSHSMTFIPTDTANYNTATKNDVSITVSKANPIVTWPTTATITYGQTLAEAVFTGSSGNGVFAYTNATFAPVVANSGTAYEVTFTPTDTANYNTPLPQNVTIIVNKANPAVTWPTGLSATYGQTLSSISLPGNGTGTPTGTFTWTTTNVAVGNVGLQSHSMIFTPTDENYNILTQNVTITVYLVTTTGIELALVPGGSFQMGQTLGFAGYVDEAPGVEITLTTDFYMGKYEVTQAQWFAVMGRTIEELQASDAPLSENYGRGDNYPVYYVTWYEALVFCNKLSIAEGLIPAYRINNSTDPAVWGSAPTITNTAAYRAIWDAAEIVVGSNGYRLPTGAQWEYAAKGGNSSPGNYFFSGSNTARNVAWYSENSGNTSHSVGELAPNGLGLYDMSGNVQEWCWNWYEGYPDSAIDPEGPESAPRPEYPYRMLRGSYWEAGFGNIFIVNASRIYPHYKTRGTGLRLVRPAQ